MRNSKWCRWCYGLFLVIVLPFQRWETIAWDLLCRPQSVRKYIWHLFDSPHSKWNPACDCPKSDPSEIEMPAPECIAVSMNGGAIYWSSAPYRIHFFSPKIYSSNFESVWLSFLAEWIASLPSEPVAHKLAWKMQELKYICLFPHKLDVLFHLFEIAALNSYSILEILAK